MKDCNEGLFEWCIKNLNQLPNKFSLTCRHRVQQSQLALSVAIWMKWDAMVGDHCWHRDIKKPKLTWGSKNPYERTTWFKIMCFLVKHIIVLFAENKMSPSKSLWSNMVEVHRWWGCFSASGTGCHDCAWHHEIWRLPKNFGAQCRTKYQKGGGGGVPNAKKGNKHVNTKTFVIAAFFWEKVVHYLTELQGCQYFWPWLYFTLCLHYEREHGVLVQAYKVKGGARAYRCFLVVILCSYQFSVEVKNSNTQYNIYDIN